jgi:ribonuclease HIII
MKEGEEDEGRQVDCEGGRKVQEQGSAGTIALTLTHTLTPDTLTLSHREVATKGVAARSIRGGMARRLHIQTLAHLERRYAYGNK